MNTFSYFELKKNVKDIYAGIRRIAYLKPRMSFSQAITFFNEGNGCWEMIKWVREGIIEVYCECLKDNEVVESEEESESVEMEAGNSVVGGGYNEEDEDILQLEA